MTLLAGLSVITIALLMRGAGRNVPIAACLPVTVGVMLAVIGNWFGKIRRNFWVGIRERKLFRLQFNAQLTQAPEGMDTRELRRGGRLRDL